MLGAGAQLGDGVVDLADPFGLLLRRFGHLVDNRHQLAHRREDVTQHLARLVDQLGAAGHLVVAVLQQAPDLAGRGGGTLRQIAHLVGDDGEAPARLAGPRRLHRGIERQQVGLEGDLLDHADDLGRLLAGIGDLPHRLHHLADDRFTVTRLVIDGVGQHRRGAGVFGAALHGIGEMVDAPRHAVQLPRLLLDADEQPFADVVLALGHIVDVVGRLLHPRHQIAQLLHHVAQRRVDTGRIIAIEAHLQITARHLLGDAGQHVRLGAERTADAAPQMPGHRNPQQDHGDGDHHHVTGNGSLDRADGGEIANDLQRADHGAGVVLQRRCVDADRPAVALADADHRLALHDALQQRVVDDVAPDGGERRHETAALLQVDGEIDMVEPRQTLEEGLVERQPDFDGADMPTLVLDRRDAAQAEAGNARFDSLDDAAAVVRRHDGLAKAGKIVTELFGLVGAEEGVGIGRVELELAHAIALLQIAEDRRRQRREGGAIATGEGLLELMGIGERHGQRRGETGPVADLRNDRRRHGAQDIGLHRIGHGIETTEKDGQQRQRHEAQRGNQGSEYFLFNREMIFHCCFDDCGDAINRAPKNTIAIFDCWRRGVTARRLDNRRRRQTEPFNLRSVLPFSAAMGKA